MIRPKLFLSYARADLADASNVCATLTAQGCAVWMDRNELLAGDDFVLGLQTHLARSDALVFLLTERAVASSWCLAELQYALGRGLVVIVVEKGGSQMLPDAVQRMLRDVQRVPWSEAGDKLASQVLRARSRAHRRLALRAGWVAAVAGGLSVIGIQAANGINRFDAARRRERFVAELRAAAAVWSGAALRARLRLVLDDPDLPAALKDLAEDPALASPVRVNAWQALAALHEERRSEWRTYVEEIQWQDGRLSNMLWANTSYGRGDIRGLVAERVRMAGLVFGAGPKSAAAGLTLGNTRIGDADIWFLRIDGTRMLDVVFENCKFRGAQLDLSEAAAVQFISREKSRIILSTDVAIMEDSWIVQRTPPPEPGVMDLAEPE